MRRILKRIWYTIFSLPPAYLAGRAAMAFMSRERVDWYKREFFCQTTEHRGLTFRLGRLVRFVEQYDFGRLSEEERGRRTFEFWAGEPGQRWHRERQHQAQDDFLRHREDCTAFLKANLPPSIDRIVEIGAGNGEALRHIRNGIGRPMRYVGVDINADTIAEAARANPAIEFHADDVFRFLTAQNDLSGTVVMSRWTAVYFTNAQMHDLLRIAKERGGAMYICENYYHRLGEGHETVYSGARKNSHDYPALLRGAGFSSVAEKHSQPIGDGGLLRILATPPRS